MKKLFLTTLLCACTHIAFAQTCEQIADNLPENTYLSFLESCEINSDLAVVVNEDDKYGFADTSGKIAIDLQFDEAWGFQEGLALVKKDNKWGYIRPDGSYAVKPIYDDAWGFSDGLAKVQKGDRFGFINTSGTIIIPIKYDDAYHWFNDGLNTVAQNDKWGLIDNQGRLLTKLHYEHIGMPSEGRILMIVKDKASNDVKYGFLDMQGNVAIEPIYQFAEPFSGGLAVVSVDDDTFSINRYGKRVQEKVDYSTF